MVETRYVSRRKSGGNFQGVSEVSVPSGTFIFMEYLVCGGFCFVSVTELRRRGQWWRTSEKTEGGGPGRSRGGEEVEDECQGRR